MTISMVGGAAAVAAVLFCSTPSWSHHSNSAFQVDKIIELKGIVTEWKWTNPHRTLMVIRPGPSGSRSSSFMEPKES